MDTHAQSKQVVLEKRVELGDFLSKLIQSLLRIGYYDPAHPESLRIRRASPRNSTISLPTVMI